MVAMRPFLYTHMRPIRQIWGGVIAGQRMFSEQTVNVDLLDGNDNPVLEDAAIVYVKESAHVGDFLAGTIAEAYRVEPKFKLLNIDDEDNWNVENQDNLRGVMRSVQSFSYSVSAS